MNATAVILVSGRIASGKTTFAEALAKRLSLPHTGFGEEVKARARAEGRPESREVLQEIGAELVAHHAEEFCRLVLARGHYVAGQGLVIDGIRHVEILKLVRRLVAPQRIFHVHLDTAEVLRAARIEERNRKGELPLPHAEKHSTEIQVATTLPAIADLTIDGTQGIDGLVEETVRALEAKLRA